MDVVAGERDVRSTGAIDARLYQLCLIRGGAFPKSMEERGESNEDADDGDGIGFAS